MKSDGGFINRFLLLSMLFFFSIGFLHLLFFIDHTRAAVSYGVDIDDLGNVSGYAWNDGVGWLDFNNITYNSATGDFSGVVDIVALSDMGQDGTLNLSGDCDPTCGGYQVSMDSNGNFSGLAWNEMIGWVEFYTTYGSVKNYPNENPSVSGYAWNDNIGWISMRDESSVGVFYGSGLCSASMHNTCRWAWGETIGWISHNSVDNPSVPIFGVHIEPDTGEVSGHFWNDYFGYADFSGANMDLETGEMSGTASILAWVGSNAVISLRGDCDPSCGGYGVSMDGDGKFSGYAWNDILGWIDFNPAMGGVQYYYKQEPSVTGWAWTDGYGWISMRFTTYDQDYGVDLQNSGNLTGYAWSQYLGWFDYDPAGPYPDEPNYSAQWDPQTQEVSGWIKAVGVEESGYNGWIKMRSTDGDSVDYGVFLDRKTGAWSGYAWGDLMGWIVYDHEYDDVLTRLDWLDPPAPVLVQPVDCVDLFDINPSAPLTPTLTWSEYYSPDGSNQQSYQIQVDDDPTFDSTLVDETVSSSGAAYAVGLGILDSNVTYYWRVRTENTHYYWSEWAIEGENGESNCFISAKHAPPDCDFVMEPFTPFVNSVTQFTDKTKTYGGSTPVEWQWDFGDGELLVGTEVTVHQNPEHTFEDVTNFQVSLTVKDSDGYTCTKTQDLTVQQLVHEFKRVIPR